MFAKRPMPVVRSTTAVRVAQGEEAVMLEVKFTSQSISSAWTQALAIEPILLNSLVSRAPEPKKVLEEYVHGPKLRCFHINSGKEGAAKQQASVFGVKIEFTLKEGTSHAFSEMCRVPIGQVTSWDITIPGLGIIKAHLGWPLVRSDQNISISLTDVPENFGPQELGQIFASLSKETKKAAGLFGKVEDIQAKSIAVPLESGVHLVASGTRYTATYCVQSSRDRLADGVPRRFFVEFPIEGQPDGVLKMQVALEYRSGTRGWEKPSPVATNNNNNEGGPNTSHPAPGGGGATNGTPPAKQPTAPPQGPAPAPTGPPAPAARNGCNVMERAAPQVSEPEVTLQNGMSDGPSRSPSPTPTSNWGMSGSELGRLTRVPSEMDETHSEDEGSFPTSEELGLDVDKEPVTLTEEDLALLNAS